MCEVSLHFRRLPHPALGATLRLPHPALGATLSQRARVSFFHPFSLWEKVAEGRMREILIDVN